MKRPSVLLLVSVLFVTCAHLCAVDAPVLPDGLYAEITTPRGAVTCELFFTRAPLTVTSFVGLAEGTLGPAPRKPFFNGLTFHRVVPGFVVQGGDPLGTGEGGPGYTFPDEFVPGLRHDATGILSMANSGPDTNGSQFFLTLAPVNRMNYLHSVFGRAVQGLDVLPQIKQGDAMTVKIVRRGTAAEAFRGDETAFHALVAKTPKAVVAHFDDPDGLLPTTPPRAKGFDWKLANFQRATSIKVYARLFEKFTPDNPGQRPGNLVGTFAHDMALPPDSVLAVYFRDTNTWGLWVGEALLPKFIKRSGSLAELTKDGALHQAKQDFLNAVKAEAERAISEAVKAAAPDKPMSDAQKTKLNVDALIDALILKLEPAS